MERKVNIYEKQQFTSKDGNNLGQFPRDSIDHLVEDLGPGFKFTGFACVVSSTSIVTVGAGRLYTNDGPVYYNDDAGGTPLNFIQQLPATGKKIAAVVAWGQTIDSDTEPRTFVTNAQTRATESRPVSTTSIRHANIQSIVGQEGPDPQRPIPPSNYLVVAWVTLNTEGVESVVMEETNRAESLEDIAADIGILNDWRVMFGLRLDTLATEMANLAGKIAGLAPFDVVLRVITDVARLKESAGLPDTYSAWGADYFLDEDESDVTNVAYLARIEEGVRFAHAAEATANLALLNPVDSSVTLTDTTFMLPAYHEVRRLSNVATAQKKAVQVPYAVIVGDVDNVYDPVTGYWYDVKALYYDVVAYKTIFVETAPKEVSISQFAFHTFNYWQHTPVRWRVRWGYPYYYSSKINFWWDQRHDPIWWTFRRVAGDTAFLILDGPPYYPILPPAGPWAWNYKWYRQRWWWWDRITDYPYWDRIKTSHSVNGSVMAQTFLNDQDGYLTGIHLFFTRKGSTGDVNVLLCETYDNGQPNPNAVLAVSTPIPPAAINIWPYATRAWFRPTLTQQGKRYAYLFVTAGNHYLATTEQNQLTSGTLFYSTDQAFFQGFGDMSRDVAFENIYAEFNSTHAEVQLQPAQLSGGIAAMDINLDAQVPEGTELTFEVQINGIWTPITAIPESATDHPLTGLPPLLNLRAVFQGTSSLMPALNIGAASQLYTWRPRADFTHFSEVRTMPAPITQVHLELRMEAWLGDAHHTLVPTLFTGKQLSGTPSIVSGGSGYVVGNTLTFASGVVLTVSTVSSGAITAVTVTNRGNVIIGGTTPANPRTQTSTSGTGTGASFNFTWTDAYETHDAVVESPAPEDDGTSLDTYTIIRNYTFSGIGPAITKYQIRMVGNTDNVLTTFHVSERVDIALA
jgi:hypothetical protein